jgi:hypothetical protein
MGVRVDYVDNLPDCGRFIYDERRVEIRSGLSPVLERSCLAHEAAHVEMRHQEQDAFCHRIQQERMASAMAGRRLISFHKFLRMQVAGVSEKEMSAELGVARVILRAYTWLTAPAWELAA